MVASLALLLPLAALHQEPAPEPIDARGAEPVLLGVVTAPVKNGLEVLHVLAGSPAEAAGVAPGDVLLELDGDDVETPDELDERLATRAPADEVRLELRRGKRKQELTATLIARRAYRGPWLVPRDRQRLGYEAPDWFAYAWANVGRREEPPTRANTRGKVVVIHAFQSW